MSGGRERSAAGVARFVVLIVILGGFVLWPQLDVLRRSVSGGNGFTLAHWHRIFDFDRPQNLIALWNSTWTSLASVLAAAVIGVPLALLVARVQFPLRGALAALALLPLFLPPIVGVLTFKQFLFGDLGIVPRFLHSAFGVTWHLDGFAGVIVLHAYAFFPFFFLFTLTGRHTIDDAMTDAAESLGADRWRTLRTIVLPLLRPALAGAAILVLLNALGSYSAPLFFAPDKEFLTLRIANLREDSPDEVAALATLLGTLALLLLIPFRKLEAAREVTGGSKGAIAPRMRPRSPIVRASLAVTAVVLLVVLLLPHLSIILLSFGSDVGATGSVLPASFTLDHYRRVFAESAFTTPLVNSFEMAGLAAAADALLGIVVAVHVARPRAPLARTIELLAFLPFALPATVLAFNLLDAFSRPGPLTLGHVLAGTWLLLPLAYFVRHLPLTVRSTQSALATLDPRLLEAAVGLGASRFATYRRVLVPLLLPGIVAGTLLAFLSALTEFTASILLYVPDNLPIGVEIFNLRYNRALGEPAALSTLLLVAQGLVALIAARIVRRRPEPALIAG